MAFDFRKTATAVKKPDSYIHVCVCVCIYIYIYIYIYTYLLTPWCRVLLEKLTGLQLVNFTEPEGSLPHSQASATCLYHGPAQSSPYTHIPPLGNPS